MKEVCLGTIGSGPIVHHILDNVKLVEGVSLKAVYSRTIERARQLADEYGCTNVYTDLDRMFADESINTIYVASPNLLHYEQTKKALLAGKHVWCEKPFTTTAAQAEELTQIAEEKGLYFAGCCVDLYKYHCKKCGTEFTKDFKMSRRKDDNIFASKKNDGKH
jgi:predicted dehydrogenase